jgi:HSP20 family molecular chaperone IbpA
MSAFSLIPVFADRPFDDPCPSSRRRLYYPFTGLDPVARKVDRLERELGMVGGVIPHKDIFEVDLDVQGYKPEDLNICVKDKLLTVSGTHEKTNEDGSHFESRHFSRRFLLPENLERDKMKSFISRDGRISCLRVEAPLKQTFNEGKETSQEIPVTHKIVKKQLGN